MVICSQDKLECMSFQDQASIHGWDVRIMQHQELSQAKTGVIQWSYKMKRAEEDHPPAGWPVTQLQPTSQPQAMGMALTKII